MACWDPCPCFAVLCQRAQLSLESKITSAASQDDEELNLMCCSQGGYHAGIMPAELP